MNYKFKIGDVVRCINDGRKGSGWKLGYEFKITSVNTFENGAAIIYWAGISDSGVCEDSLELARPKNLWKGKKR